MFTGFFYLLRAHGFRVSLNEWMTLIEGLMLDLQHDSLTGFYELCRAVLVKSEADYDKFRPDLPLNTSTACHIRTSFPRS